MCRACSSLGAQCPDPCNKHMPMYCIREKSSHVHARARGDEPRGSLWPANHGSFGTNKPRDVAATSCKVPSMCKQVFITLDDGVYEFTLGDGNEWICSRDKIQIKPECKIFAPANMRAAQEVDGYNNLIQHYMTNKFTLRYTGGALGAMGRHILKLEVASPDITRAVNRKAWCLMFASSSPRARVCSPTRLPRLWLRPS